ncbi:hypothetical protein TcasGA2_TC009522 [Tribolium castaneum]|uniref:Uncharacterized protein n=1 Tax=Tribolium castaneum TaxID=7070 RepID=D6WS05_TRICA|nr:hypothetical protein TcasGA2_TC009522 [Tribolium castaneum]
MATRPKDDINVFLLRFRRNTKRKHYIGRHNGTFRVMNGNSDDFKTRHKGGIKTSNPYHHSRF